MDLMAESLSAPTRRGTVSRIAASIQSPASGRTRNVLALPMARSGWR